jgi:hypothetical protein
MGIFGWSYPPGCSGPPDGYYNEFLQPRCHCGAFVSAVAEGTKEVFYQEDDMGPDLPKFSPPVEVLEARQLESPWGDDHPKWWSWKMRYPVRIPITHCKRCGAEVQLGE